MVRLTKLTRLVLLANCFEREKPEVSCSATVCDTLGNIFIADIDNLQVVEIDGIKPADILPEAIYEPPSPAENTNTSADYDEEFEEEFEDEEFEEEFDRRPRFRTCIYNTQKER